MPTIIREESDATATANSSLAVVLAVIGLAVVMAIGYFAWYVPAQTPAVIDRQTVIHDNNPPSTTIVNPPAAQAPLIIQGQAGPKGDPGPAGPKGDSAPSNSSGTTPSTPDTPSSGDTGSSTGSPSSNGG